MRIACDIDGVLADIEPEINRRVSEHFGLEVDQVRKDKFYMHDRFDIDPETMDKFLQTHVFNEDDFWYIAEPFEDNIRALQKLRFYDHQVYFVTGRHNSCRDVTERWIRDYVMSPATVLMQALDVKHRAIKFVDAELMIEDRYAEAATIARKGYRSYCLRRHYNLRHEGTHENDGVIWVDNISEIVEREKLNVLGK